MGSWRLVAQTSGSDASGRANNVFVIYCGINVVAWSVESLNRSVDSEILALPADMRAFLQRVGLALARKRAKEIF